MIDAQHHRRRALCLAGPVGQQMHQGEGITATGNSDCPRPDGLTKNGALSRQAIHRRGEARL